MEEKEKTQIKLSFSGGGFRATFFCLGAYRRLVELGLDSTVSHITSVSGGSITAGAIMNALSDKAFLNLEDFDLRVTQPLKNLGQLNFRNKLIRKALSPIRLRNYKPEKLRTRFSKLFPELLDKHLFNNKLMKELPSSPEWSCNATCLNTLKRFRFKPSDMYGFELGYCYNMDRISVSLAVAASAAFPMMFEPIAFNVEDKRFDNKYSSKNLQYKTLYLTDGGVYDNLGSENLLKEDIPSIILDASAATTPWPENYRPSFHKMFWRVLAVSLDQIVLLRRRLIFHHSNKNCIQLLLNKKISELVDFESKYRKPALPFPTYSKFTPDIESLIAELRTDLDLFTDDEIELLMWAGAIRMDLAIKSLCPQLFNNHLWNNIPNSPPQPTDDLLSKLMDGKARKFFRSK